MSTRISALQEGKTDAEVSPWKLGGLTVGQLGKRLWIALNDDDIFGRAAQLAYSFFFSIFPLLLFLSSVVGVIARNNPSLRAGAVMILLLWFYVIGAAILMGGEVNAEIENAAAKRGAPVKEKGQKTPKERVA